MAKDLKHGKDNYLVKNLSALFAFCYLQDIVQLIEDLEAACIRFVHFSKENELRSRVFSEKMGLEAGWNCHVSLRSEEDETSTSPPSQHDLSHSNIGGRRSTHSMRHSSESLHQDLAMAGIITRTESHRSRRCSAPSAINVDTYHVKFEPDRTIEEMSTCSSASKSDYKPTHTPVHQAKSDIFHDSPDISKETDKLTNASQKSSPAKDLPSPGSGEKPCDPLLENHVHEEDFTRRLSSRSSGGLQGDDVDLVTGENLSSSESYPASSHFTENTDSVTGFGLSNRVRSVPA